MGLSKESVFIGAVVADQDVVTHLSGRHDLVGDHHRYV